jgi:hypothetical protein
MERDPNESSTLHAVPDLFEEDFPNDSTDLRADAFRADWLAGGLQDRLVA